MEAYRSAQGLKATTTLISQKERELNAGQAVLAAAEVRVLADVIAARAEGRVATEAKVVAVRAEAEEVVTTA